MKRYPALSGDQSTLGMSSHVMAMATGPNNREYNPDIAPQMIKGARLVGYVDAVERRREHTIPPHLFLHDVEHLG